MNKTTANPLPFTEFDRHRAGASRPFHRIVVDVTVFANRFPGFVALCDQGVVSVTNFATGVIIGRVCGKAELGIYALAWTIMTLATEFSATLTTTPYAVFGPQLSSNQRRLYLGSIFLHQFTISMLSAMAIAAGAALGLWGGWLSKNLSGVVMATAWAVVFVGLREFARRVSFAELKVGAAFLVDGITCIGQAAGLCFLLRAGLLTASRSFAVLGTSSAFVVVGWLIIRWDSLHLNPASYREDLKRNWIFAKWVLGSSLLWTLATYLYPWLLVAFRGAAVTGLWAACSTIVGLGNPVLLGLSNHVGPQIHTVYANSGIPAMRRCVYRSSLMFAGLILPIILILACGGGRIVTGVYGKAYSGGAVLVLLLALNMLVSAFAYPYSRGLFSLERAKLDMLVNVVAVALLFIVGIVAVKFYGVFGAATTLLLSNIIATVIRIGVFAREIRHRTPHDFSEMSPNAGQLVVGLVE